MNHKRYSLAPFHAARLAVGNLCDVFRQTGRTNALLDTLKKGDRFIVPNPSLVPVFQDRLQQRGITGVEVFYLPIDMLCVDIPLHTSSGKTVFDHSWVEIFAVTRIRRLEAEFQRAADMISGFDERHEATRARAQAFHAAVARGIPPDNLPHGAV
jgi:hypothetical protein